LSSQRTTTHRGSDTHLGWPALGALVQLYCVTLALSTGISRLKPI